MQGSRSPTAKPVVPHAKHERMKRWVLIASPIIHADLEVEFEKREE